MCSLLLLLQHAALLHTTTSSSTCSGLAQQDQWQHQTGPFLKDQQQQAEVRKLALRVP